MKIILFLSLSSWAFQLNAQDLATITCVVSDFKDKPRKGETIYFLGQKTKKKFENVSNDKGIAEIKLPKGDTYEIQLLAIGEEKEYSTIEIPDKPGNMTAKVTIQFELPLTVDLNDITFESGASTIKTSSFKQLDKLVLMLERKTELKIEVIGHTDNVGNADKNLQLSKDRANAVKKYIVSKGIKSERITTNGKGASEPVADNDTEKGKAKNRRTEIRIVE